MFKFIYINIVNNYYLLIYHLSLTRSLLNLHIYVELGKPPRGGGKCPVAPSGCATDLTIIIMNNQKILNPCIQIDLEIQYVYVTV